jgi:hypothetical protein
MTVEAQIKRKTGLSQYPSSLSDLLLGYYVQNIVVLIMMLQIMGLSIFFVSGSSIDSRASISITLFLAAVAFQFIVSGITPRISHSTYLSEFFFFTYGIIVLEVVESVASGLIFKYGSENSSGIFDWVCLAIFTFLNCLYCFIFVARGLRQGKLAFVEREQQERL